jgi:predicted 2-oxoglutarate/Fe(II)-dependent dioxygenase YbiX
MFQYTTIKNLLTKKECDEILNFSLLNLELVKGEVGIGELIENQRKSSVKFYNFYKTFPYLMDRIKNELENNDVFNIKGFTIDLTSELIQFTEYKPGEFYGWHTDIDEYQTNNRYCSMVIQLNNEYEGGKLQLKDNENVINMEPGKGNLFIFKSDILHQVNKVTKGKRYSLVSWMHLKPIPNFKKTLI